MHILVFYLFTQNTALHLPPYLNGSSFQPSLDNLEDTTMVIG